MDGLNFISVKGIEKSFPFQSIQTIPCIRTNTEMMVFDQCALKQKIRVFKSLEMNCT